MFQRRRLPVLGTILLLIAIPLIVRAAPGLIVSATLPPGNVPTTLSYQGTLTDSGGVPVDGTVSMSFAIYDAPSGGTALWTETQPGVTVARGYFSVYLGDVNPLSSSLFGGQSPLYLGVQAGADPEMTPRLRIASVPYAFSAQAAPPCSGTVCSGSCVNLGSDPTNCGSCGNTCALFNAVPGCNASQCVIASCSNNYANCNGNTSDGCEISINSDPNNCGACGNVCQTFSHAAATCTNGACTSACNPGYGDCNGDLSTDGCEVNLSADVYNCGGCNNACIFAHASPVCAAGTCMIASCNAGYGDCDGSPLTGCEANFSTNVNNCGGCGNACVFANASPVCAAGACMIGSCNPGYGNCDGSSLTGCEVNLATNVNNCGSCGNVCAQGQSCVAGACVW